MSRRAHCDSCGGSIYPRRHDDLAWDYVKGGRLAKGLVPETIAVPTCVVCGETYLSPALTRAIDRALGADE